MTVDDVFALVATVHLDRLLQSSTDVLAANLLYQVLPDGVTHEQFDRFRYSFLPEPVEPDD